MRNILLSILGLLLIGVAIIGGNRIVQKINKPKPKFKRQIKTKFTFLIISQFRCYHPGDASCQAKRKCDIEKFK